MLCRRHESKAVKATSARLIQFLGFASPKLQIYQKAFQRLRIFVVLFEFLWVVGQIIAIDRVLGQRVKPIQIRKASEPAFTLNQSRPIHRAFHQFF
jgi:hypothetical protein